MRIKTFNPYKSIVETPTTEELPAFTLITGQNGAGKTHLLESMREMATQFEGGFHTRRPRMLGTADLQVVSHMTTSPETREPRGHDLAERLRTQFPGLGQHQGHLLDDTVGTIWAEHPWAIPRSIATTFKRLLES